VEGSSSSDACDLVHSLLWARNESKIQAATQAGRQLPKLMSELSFRALELHRL
jgi:hypothetical protein